jgi:PAS domain S-box-containing protein
MKDYLNSKKETRFILISFMILALLAVGSKLLDMYELSVMNSITDDMYEYPLKVSNAALTIKSEVYKIHRDMKDIVLSESKEKFLQGIKEVDEHEQHVYIYLNIIRQNIQGDEGKKLEQQTRELFHAWKPIRDEVIRSVKNDQRAKAIAITQNKGADHVLKLEISNSKLYDYAHLKAIEFKNYSDSRYQRMEIIIALVGIAVLILFILLTYYTVRRISIYVSRNEHLTNVLSVIRDVNQLIVREKDRQVLIQESCNILVSNHVYANAWIILYEDEKCCEYMAGSDNSETFTAFRKKVESGWVPYCIQKVSAQNGNHILIENTKESCLECPLTDKYKNKGAFSIELVYNDKVYGNLTLSVNENYLNDPEEILLLNEVAGDIAYALYNFETEQNLQKHESALIYYKNLYENIIDSVDNMIFVKDINFNYIVCNQGFEKFVGKSNQEIVGKNDYDIFSDDVANFFREHDQIMLTDKKSKSNFEWVTYPDGEEIYLFTVKSPLLDSTGTLIGLVGNSVDLTEQKRAQDALYESEKHFRSLIQQSPSAIELYDLNGLQIEVNHAYEELWGFPAKHTLNTFNLFSSEEVKKTGLIEYILKAYAGESVSVPPYEFDSSVPTEADGMGKKRWLSTRIYPLKDGNEKVKNIVITHEDITEKIDNIQQLEQKKKELETILQEAPNPIMLHNEDGKVLMVNHVWETLTGYTYEEIDTIDKWIAKAYRENYSAIKKEIDKLYELKHKFDEGEYTLLTKDNDSIIWQFSSAPLGIIDGKRTVVTSAMDITELKKKDDLMMAQSRHAAMGEMIGMIAHQWRQPIAGIAMDANNMLLDIALETFDNDTAEGYAQDILDQTRHLSKTIDDFRNFFKPDKTVSHVNLQEIIDETFTIVKESLISHKIDIRTSYLTETKIDVYSRELMQVFVNIINNAKDALLSTHTKDPFISIKVYEDDQYLNTEICDNGGGIDKAIFSKLFDPYFTTKDEKIGTGLGLYMSKVIVEDHLHGIIEAFNFREGACFWVKLM